MGDKLSICPVLSRNAMVTLLLRDIFDSQGFTSDILTYTVNKIKLHFSTY